ncbi:MAG: hypothetical protein A2V21_311930 [Deltaproteobacteria bacterium GWC2_55_46]|nr:MAG: hypothetical protein A2Z79_11685 [Deltaproteobacteria bacterium GWA2_55_82]OGQ63528.1 MAG: hypothetical protein A3I81_05875 [Deltaproteobacteria bacterium RIFCSPLOWO2_02_FULL_55_12]OIJ74910.1 MAG: hypothetical protein A2V21_311930 [Deltaproteobacteria bacterium GWC2_55_46]
MVFFLLSLCMRTAAADENRCVLPQGLTGFQSEVLTKDECEKVSSEIMKKERAQAEILNKLGGKTKAVVEPAEISSAVEARETTDVQSSVPQPSLFDRYISATQKWDVQASSLKPFGYDIFTTGSASQQNLPVSQDYVIGPGDEIQVLLWGRVTGQYSLSVNRDGTIQFPNVGPLTVSGMTFEKMKSYLSSKAGKIVGTQISVTMGRLRSIQVFVLGEVKRPGAYEISAMSTVTNALMASGGASGIGSLRRVDLKRGNMTVASIDFYELLTSGDKSSDLRLHDSDVVFVNVVGPIVGIAGNVKRPAVYELKESTDLAAALRLAGGTIPTAFTQRLQVERVQDNLKKVVIDIDASQEAAARSFILLDGDFIKVFPVVDRDSNAVYLEGNVKRPGKYELKKGMRVRDIIKDERDLLEESALDYAIVKRFSAPAMNAVMLMPFNPGALFSGSEKDDISLMPGDVIQIFSRWAFMDKSTVSIFGEVRCDKLNGGQDAGGCYFELENRLTVKDLVHKAGGLTKDASLEWLEIYRTDKRNKEVTLIKLSLGSALSGDNRDNIMLEDMDRVVVHSVRETTPQSYVTLHGALNRPGKYPYASNMTVKDMVFAAGGVHESAYLEDAELAIGTVADSRNYVFEYRKIDLSKALAGDPEHNLPVPPYASLFVMQVRNWQSELFVELKGEFVNPGNYRIKRGEKLSSVIKRAGGFTTRAYLKGAVFTRESIRDFQQKNIDEAASRLEKVLLSSAPSEIEGAMGPEAAKQAQAAIEQKKALIAQMRASRAEGRIGITLEEHLEGTPYDFEFEDKDVLTVPSRPSQVQVMGSVYNQLAFLYTPDATVEGYLKKAGGTTANADEDAIFILKVDGTAVSKKESSWDSGSKSWFSGGFMSAKLNPGDTIIVPEKLDKIHWLREIKDLTQILYQIAVTAGVLIVVF